MYKKLLIYEINNVMIQGEDGMEEIPVQAIDLDVPLHIPGNK